jgi:hypothetical protein
MPPRASVGGRGSGSLFGGQPLTASQPAAKLPAEPKGLFRMFPNQFPKPPPGSAAAAAGGAAAAGPRGRANSTGAAWPPMRANAGHTPRPALLWSTPGQVKRSNAQMEDPEQQSGEHRVGVHTACRLTWCVEDTFLRPPHRLVHLLSACPPRAVFCAAQTPLPPPGHKRLRSNQGVTKQVMRAMMRPGVTPTPAAAASAGRRGQLLQQPPQQDGERPQPAAVARTSVAREMLGRLAAGQVSTYRTSQRMLVPETHMPVHTRSRHAGHALLVGPGRCCSRDGSRGSAGRRLPPAAAVLLAGRWRCCTARAAVQDARQQQGHARWRRCWLRRAARIWCVCGQVVRVTEGDRQCSSAVVLAACALAWCTNSECTMHESTRHCMLTLHACCSPPHSTQVAPSGTAALLDAGAMPQQVRLSAVAWLVAVVVAPHVRALFTPCHTPPPPPTPTTC